MATVLRECSLEGVGRQLIGTLSRGYRQRVGLAQCLLHQPRILILDEPSAGLDPTQIRHLHVLLRALRGRTTILLSSHLLSEVAALCDRVLVLHRGRVVADGAVQQLTTPVLEEMFDRFTS